MKTPSTATNTSSAQWRMGGQKSLHSVSSGTTGPKCVELQGAQDAFGGLDIGQHYEMKENAFISAV